jgi:hypothetical protein
MPGLMVEHEVNYAHKMIARTLHCSCGWIVEQEHYDTEGKFLQIIKDIHQTTFPDHRCEIKEG